MAGLFIIMGRHYIVTSCVCVQREVSKKLHVRLPELSKLLDATLAKAPKEQFGPPSAQIWKRIMVRLLIQSLR